MWSARPIPRLSSRYGSPAYSRATQNRQFGIAGRNLCPDGAVSANIDIQEGRTSQSSVSAWCDFARTQQSFFNCSWSVTLPRTQMTFAAEALVFGPKNYRQTRYALRPPAKSDAHVRSPRRSPRQDRDSAPRPA